MAIRKPLIIVSGIQSELPPGDFVEGVQVTLVSNPSGLYVQGTDLGLDGAAQRSADVALASGNAALSIIASGVPFVAPNAVTTASISGLQVTTPKIANGAVTTPKIANGAVTLAKLEASLAALLNPNYYIDLL
jgi:hypothetical protein